MQRLCCRGCHTPQAETLCPDGPPSWAALESPDTRYPGWRKAATTLGLSAEQWPPPVYNRELWMTRRPKYHILAAGDEVKVGEQMRLVRANALQEFKSDPSIDVLLMDGVRENGLFAHFVCHLKRSFCQTGSGQTSGNSH